MGKFQKHIGNGRVTYEYTSGEIDTYVLMDDEEVRGVAAGLYGISLGLLMALMVWMTQDELSPHGLATLFANTYAGFLLFTALIMLLRAQARYTAAVLIAAVAIGSTVVLMGVIDILLQLLGTLGLLTVSYLLMKPLPHQIYRAVLYLSLSSLVCMLIYLGASERAVVSESISNGLWYGSLVFGLSTLFYGLYVQGYPGLLADADDRYERASRGW